MFDYANDRKKEDILRNEINVFESRTITHNCNLLKV